MEENNFCHKLAISLTAGEANFHFPVKTPHPNPRDVRLSLARKPQLRQLQEEGVLAMKSLGKLR
jgi:hypothetical protein